MGHNMASWKLLEDMLIAVKKQGVTIPDSIVEDLRSAKSMIQLSCMEESGEAVQKAEEFTSKVEAFLVTEAQKVFGSEVVDGWLRQLEEAGVEPVCVMPAKVEEGKFVVGVPRDQKWVRVTPMENLSAEKIVEMAKLANLQVNSQSDGRLVIYGKPEDLKGFVSKMTALSAKPK